LAARQHPQRQEFSQHRSNPLIALTLARQEHACASHGACGESPTEARKCGRPACQFPLRLRARLLDGHPQDVALGEMFLEVNTRFDCASVNVYMLSLMRLLAFPRPTR